MNMITLAEAVKLKSILNKRIQELTDEVRRVAFTRIEKGEIPSAGPRTLETVENELEIVRTDSRKLDALMYRANIDHTISFHKETLPIVEAIELASQLRAKASLYKEFAAADKETIEYGYGETTTVYTVALFEPEDYRIKALETEKLAHKLSNKINAINYTITLDFNDDDYF